MGKKGGIKNVHPSKGNKKGVNEKGFVKNHLHLLLLGAVAVITFAIYAPALRNEFTNWDDNVYVTANTHITSLSKTNLAYIFSNPVAVNYHPLTIISLALNYKFAGLTPFSYYLVNILFHLFNILLVYWLVLLISQRNRTMALFVAALFAVHPMHVESVAWIAERKDVLYTFFFLGGLISYFSYLDKKGRVFYFLCILLFLLSSLSKPTAVVFPVVLFLIDYFRKRKVDFLLFAEKIPFLAISVWIGLQTMHSQVEMVAADMENYNILQKFIFASYGFMMYIYKLIVPIGLSAFYPFPKTGQGYTLPLIFWIAPLFVAVLIAGVVYSLKYTRLVAFGVLFYFAAIALTLQFVQVGHAIIAERYAYLSYIGLLIALFWIVDKALSNKRLFSVNLSYLVLLLFFIVNVCLAFQRVPVWKNSDTLWGDVIEKFPNTDIAYNNRGLYHYDKGQYPQTVADYTNAIRVNPRYFEAYYNRGGVYLKINKPREAIEDFNAAIAINPDYSVSYCYRGNAYNNLGKPDSAILDYHKAIQVNPDYTDSYINLGNTYMNSGQIDKAILNFKAAIERRDNDPQSWFYLGSAFGKNGNFSEAVNCLTKALEYKPDYYDALTNRANAEASLGKGEAALNDLAAAITINPENHSAYFNRAIYFLNTGKKDLACIDLQKAVKLGNNAANAIIQKECQGK